MFLVFVVWILPWLVFVIDNDVVGFVICYLSDIIFFKYFRCVV